MRPSLRPLLPGTLAAALIVLASLPLHAVSVVIQFELTQGTASIDPFEIPNPADPDANPLTIAPSITIESGSFEAVFENADPHGLISDGPASIRNLTFSGSLDILVSTTVFIPISANITGPLIGTQLTDSQGSITSILGGNATYLDTSPGLFDITAGPLDCEDSFLGIICALLDGIDGIDFPIEIPAISNAPLPFVGAFTDLNVPGNSNVNNTLDFSIPLGEAATFGAELSFLWTEQDRALVVVPEPSSLTFLALSSLALLRRRRSNP